MNPRIYHLASMVGLFPTQLLGVYLGSTLRAMQDAWEHKNFSTSAYVVITIQVSFHILLICYFQNLFRNFIKLFVTACNGQYDDDLGRIQSKKRVS